MKQLNIAILLIVLMSMVGVKAMAYDCKVDGLCYYLDNNNHTAVVTYSGKPYNNEYTGHYGGSGLNGKAINIPSTITYNDMEYTVIAIGDDAFYDCESSILISSVTIPSSVISIGKRAFYRCTNLTSIMIPSSVTSIGSSAFYDCSGLTSVTIPNSLTSIGSFAFDGTAWYNNKPDGMVYAGKVAYKYKGIMPDNTNIIIEEKTISISAYAFLNCSNLTSVTIPNSVIVIGEKAFLNCSCLTSVTADIVTPLAISYDTFSNRTNATLYVPYGCKAAYEAADYWKEFKEIVEMAPISNISFADANVKAICVANWDTNSDGELSEAEAAAVTDLGEVFKGSSITSFDELQFFTGLDEIGRSAFEGCSSLASVIIPDGVYYLNEKAFAGCSSLTSLIIPNNVYNIDYDVFQGCTGLTSITVPNNVAYLGSGAFGDCSGLTTVVLPEGLTRIESYTFYGCSSLTDITIPSSVEYIGDEAFYYCQSLKEVTIPDKVATICEKTFYFCNQLSSIVIPNSVKTIEESAFDGCSSLTSLTIGDGVTSIGNYAFAGCGMTSVIIPNSVMTIGGGSFASCEKLTNVTIPSSVTSIGEYAFFESDNLTTVIVEMTTPVAITENVFSNRTNATLYVPVGYKPAYKAADYWKEFKEIWEIGNVGGKCATPIITYANGKVSFDSETEGVDYVYTCTIPSSSEQTIGSEFTLSTKYTVTVYAKKEGYEDSDLVTKVIDVRGLKGDVNEDGVVSITDAVSVVNIILNGSE